MIRHMVMFRLTDCVTDENRTEVLAQMRVSVENMAGKIPGLSRAELWINTGDGPYDIMMYGELECREDLPVYAAHPLHAAHRERMKDYVCDRIVFDSEI